MLDHRLPEPLKLDFLVEVEIAVVEKMYKILDGTNGGVLARGKTLIRLSLELGAHEALDLDYLLHVLVEELLLLLELDPDGEGFSSSLQLRDGFFMLVQLLEDSRNLAPKKHGTCECLEGHHLVLVRLQLVEELVVLLSIQERSGAGLEGCDGGCLLLQGVQVVPDAATDQHAPDT